MRAFVKSAAQLVAVTCLVWVAVLWHWRSSPQEMDARGMVIYLVVLPAVLFMLVLAARWAVRSALARENARAAVALAAASAMAGAAAGSTAPPTGGTGPAPWHLLGAWARTAGGDGVDELLTAIEAGSPRPGPDDALQDDDGLPVMTARITALDTDIDIVEAELQRHAEQMPVPMNGESRARASLRAVRALTCLAPLIDELVQTAHRWCEQPIDASPPATAMADERSAKPPPAASPLEQDRIIRVLAAWPDDWDDGTCRLAQSWLAERLGDPLAGAVRPGGWSIGTQRMNGAELLSAAQRTLDLLAGERRDDPVVLIACHSDLDDDAIQSLEAAHQLFHPTRRPKVSMAGEGAAVLALSAVRWPADAGAADEPVRLTCPALVRRSQSIDAAGRSSPQDALEAVRLSLARAGLPAAAIAKLASDADQHTARATELFAVTLALMPDLDANDDFRLAGTLTGRLGAAAPLLTLACAASQARAGGRPAIALSLADPHWRMVAVVVPESFAIPPEPT